MAASVNVCRSIWVFALTVAICVLTVRAQELPPPAYQLAAHDAGIPSAILFAVALQESGLMLHGRLVPWPWTLNIAGTGYRYATREESCAALHRALKRVPAIHVDAGLGQVNLGFQAGRFGQPCELLNPYLNLAITASILRERHDPGEDWLIAVGRYHRPAGGEPAARYQRSVRRHLTRVLGTNAIVSAGAPRSFTP